MNSYYLKHRDIIVALFSISGGGICNLKYTENHRIQELIPLGTRNSKTLSKWIESRGVPVTRKGIREELEGMNIPSTFELMLLNHGLSLTDNYWICPIKSKLTWENINLYKNDFKARYSLNLLDDKSSIVSKTEFVPSASLNGDLKKKWVIAENGVRILVKGNYNNSCRQSISEVFASLIHKLQGSFAYTDYSFVDIESDGKIIKGCMCGNFTTECVEFVPAIDVVNSYVKQNDMSYYEFYIDLCNRYGIDIRNMLEYQIMTDFVISNTDRHLNNFGILRNAQTLKWVGYAPIFDSGNSLFYRSSYIPVDRGLLNLDITSFVSKEVKLLKYVRNRGLVDIRKLPSDEVLYSLLCNDSYIDDSTKERIVRSYMRKVSYLEDFQNGANLWGYNYRVK